MLANKIPKERLADCLTLLKSANKADLDNEPKEIILQTGGLFNFLLRVETSTRTVYFKQYLDNVPNATYNPPKIAAKIRAQLAYDVQKIAANATLSKGLSVVPDLIFFDEELSAFLMTEASGKTTLIDFLSKGNIPDNFLSQLPVALACLHESTYGKYGPDSIYGNQEFRDFKLNLQYDGIIPFLSSVEAKAVMDCKKLYQQKFECVTHGDINSRNILIGDVNIGIIDFEQSHLGSPSYDLSYILCELVISAYQFHKHEKLGLLITTFLDQYFNTFTSGDRSEIEREITKHLAIQTIYRFVGPSRSSWTFYVDEKVKDVLINRCKKMLLEDQLVGLLEF